MRLSGLKGIRPRSSGFGSNRPTSREYQKIDQFWLARRDETVVRVRLYGQKVLTMEQQKYTLNETLNKGLIVEAAKGQ